MTKRHFEAFARFIREGIDNPEADKNCRLYAAIQFIRLAEQYNPRFDRARFLKACGLE